MAAGASGIRAGRAFVELGVSDKLTAGLRKAQKRLKAFGAAVTGIGARLTAASAAAATPFVLATAVFARFEQRMARVRALTSATGDEFKALNVLAKKLGQTTVFSASQAAEAMGIFGLAGFKVGEIMAAVGPTLNLAAAGQLEIAEAADIATKVMKTMGLAADQLGTAVDVLTQAMTTANTDLLQLGEAMKFVGPVARTAGLSLEQTVAAIQLLSNAGLQGTLAGTSLRAILVKLVGASGDAAQALDDLHVRVKDVDGNVRPLADIVEDLNAGLDGLGSAERLKILSRIFGQRQVSGISVLLKAGADQLRQFTKALEDSGGTADRIAKIQLNTLQGSVTLVKSAVEGLGIAIGTSIVAPLRVAAAVIQKVVTAITSWVRANQETVVLVAGLVVSIGALGTVLVAIGVAAQVAAFVLGGLASIAAVVTGAISALGAAFGAILTPIGLVIAAIVALGTFLVVKTGIAADAIQFLADQFDSLKKDVKIAVKGMTDALAAGDIELAAKILWLAIKAEWQQGVSAIQSVWLKGKAFFVRTFHKTFSGALVTMEEVRAGLETAWIETTAFLSKTWTKFTSLLKSALARSMTFVEKRWAEIRGLFDDSFDSATAKDAADKALKAKLSEIEDERNALLKDRERKRKSDRERAKQISDATLAEIGKQLTEAENALDEATKGGLEKTQAALAEARKKLREAIAKAKQERKDSEQPDKLKTSPVRDFAATVKVQLEKARTATQQKSKDIASRGTFSASFASRLGGGFSSFERTARATEETAKNTKKIANAQQGLSFS